MKRIWLVLVGLLLAAAPCLEELLVLLEERVLGRDQDLDQRVQVQLVERADHRQTPHQLGDQPEGEQVFGFHLPQELGGRGRRPRLLLEAHASGVRAALDDFSRPTKAPPQMNRMSLVLTRMYSCCGCLRPPWAGRCKRCLPES